MNKQNRGTKILNKALFNLVFLMGALAGANTNHGDIEKVKSCSSDQVHFLSQLEYVSFNEDESGGVKKTSRYDDLTDFGKDSSPQAILVLINCPLKESDQIEISINLKRGAKWSPHFSVKSSFKAFKKPTEYYEKSFATFAAELVGGDEKTKTVSESRYINLGSGASLGLDTLEMNTEAHLVLKINGVEISKKIISMDGVD